MSTSSKNNIIFYLTQCWAIVFWALPEPIQKPFRIGLLAVSLLVFITSIRKAKFRDFLLPLLIITSLLFIMWHGSFQSSIINVMLSTFLVTTLNLRWQPFTPKQIKIAKIVSYICCIALLLQLVFIRANDGRPSLAYEINWGAAYLFIFFLYNDYLKVRICKVFVILASLVILSRLLILSLLLFYIMRLIKPFLKKIRVPYFLFYAISLSLFFVFNYYFLDNATIDYSVASNERERITNLNDGSNKNRFTFNTLVLENMFKDEQLLYGYPLLVYNTKYQLKYKGQPHNEFLDSVVEFGYICTLCFILFSFPLYRRYFRWQMYDYYIPLMIYTFILWARFLIVPSPEMFFILFLIMSKYNEYQQEQQKFAYHLK